MLKSQRSRKNRSIFHMQRACREFRISTLHFSKEDFAFDMLQMQLLSW